MVTGLRQIWRRYHKTSSIGPKFKNFEEIRKYVETPRWSVTEFLEQGSGVTSRSLPSTSIIERLLRLSGLPVQNIEEYREILGKQLMFLDKLETLDVCKEIDPKHARLMVRENKALGYEELMQLAQDQHQDEKLGETSGSWEGVKFANESKQGFYVLHEALMKRQ
ncbi:LADA_0H09692g1_1 [Lachancea dasiensis]|uniref:Glutamyl-tRNA(Gln) amidotransferase subunit F, mitochondrial n=1 Tax=Lachancea dasiensis TaxID=1072105 RepID=A0A1G4K2U7_9SACH|nr:LADA_0H09692g1_1 [Lachancea dasiensis]